MDEAVAALRPGALAALGFASTSAGYALGHGAEAALVARLESRWRVPAESTSVAAVAALRFLGVERLALLHPPWFGDALHRLGVEYFTGRGFQVTGSVVTDLPDDPPQVRADDVVAAVPRCVPDSAQAVFLGGNGFRTTSAIARLEAALGRPVLAANQVLLWSLLDKAGQHPPITGYGSLFGPDAAG